MQHMCRRLPQGGHQHVGAVTTRRQVAERRALARLLVPLAARQVYGGTHVLAGGQDLHHHGVRHPRAAAASSDQQVGVRGQRGGKLHAAAAHRLVPQAAQAGAVAGGGAWRSRGGITGHACIEGN
jgi:hypothetical protein